MHILINLLNPYFIFFFRRMCCQGDKGLLSKILDTLIATPPNASIRFWLSRAIEGFLRGRASFGDQLFLVKRGLLEVSEWNIIVIIINLMNTTTVCNNIHHNHINYFVIINTSTIIIKSTTTIIIIKINI